MQKDENLEEKDTGTNLEQDASTQEKVSEQEKASEHIEALKQKIKELEESNLRTHADFENVKKRLAREKDSALDYAYEAFAKDLLSVVDALERALESANEAKQESIATGISLTLDNLLKVLGKHGVSKISCEGEFNPTLHDGIMHEVNEAKKDGEISRVLQVGYIYKDRVLRPAMVSITKN
ncbi:nucleotide exchange factor GrpE [Helicobacter sp. 11S02629-2]|uniref:nucleotide exchange factor GrpE n=1 Tax=Helicobacter sp. 11S02629-2 TaxID=1476195 RepID=UPI000BA6DD2F|nr:nucleotide exchange factor GrpE [Helicobacter sp. 11S02629-2]PAF46048.1 nucleotide exchange factor GrpE [Helicobacter sp. 11S02629-2]